MASDQYKLRLRDGTVVAVDEQGLRTWVLDDKAMVQPPGARGWWPIRDVMAELKARQRDAAAAPRVAPARPVAAPPPPTVEPDAVPVVPVRVARPLAAVAPPEPDDASESLLDVAAAQVERHSGQPAWQWQSTGPRAEPAEDRELQELELVEDDEKAAAAPAAAAERVPSVRTAAPRLRRGMLVAGLLALAVVAASVWSKRKAENVQPAAPLRPSTPMPAPTAPLLSKEVAAAAAQLPHLAAETVQLVMSRSEFGPLDPPEVFRRAQAAADRGLSALTQDEAQELATLRSAVLAPLRKADRERVRAYDRVHTGRELMPAEDAKVLGLYARGARALPPPRRERLQALLGKAVAAGLAPPARPPAP